jgi:hypothetical protein
MTHKGYLSKVQGEKNGAKRNCHATGNVNWHGFSKDRGKLKNEQCWCVTGQLGRAQNEFHVCVWVLVSEGARD